MEAQGLEKLGEKRYLGFLLAFSLLPSVLLQHDLGIMFG